MARVFIGDYHIYYSIIDGTIHDFEKKNVNGEYVAVNDEPELIDVAKDVVSAQSKAGIGYSAFIYKLIDDGKINQESLANGQNIIR